MFSLINKLIDIGKFRYPIHYLFFFVRSVFCSSIPYFLFTWLLNYRVNYILFTDQILAFQCVPLTQHDLLSINIIVLRVEYIKLKTLSFQLPHHYLCFCYKLCILCNNFNFQQSCLFIKLEISPTHVLFPALFILTIHLSFF